MQPIELRFDDVSDGRPFHAALVTVTEGWRDRPAPHGHADFLEILYVVEGQGLQRLSEGDVRLRSGDLAVIGPGECHEFAAFNGSGLRFVNIAFPTTTWHSFATLALGAADGWLANPRSAVITVDHEREQVEDEFRRALRAFNASPAPLDLARFWCHVVPHLAASRPRHAGDRHPPPDWLLSACRAMEEEENLREGLPRMVELAAISPSHLVRVMRRHYGCTPVAYVNERRLEQAAMLLATTAQRITEIASRCGFESASYFTRRFRERYDLSPRDYRRQRQESVVPAHSRRTPGNA